MDWRPVPGWPRYEINNEARVRVAKTTRPLVHARRDRDGLLEIFLQHERRRAWVHLHRILCAAFHGAQPSPMHRAVVLGPRRAPLHSDSVAWLTRKQERQDPRVARHAKGAALARQILALRPLHREPGGAEEVAAILGVTPRFVRFVWSKGRHAKAGPPTSEDLRQALRRAGDTVA